MNLALLRPKISETEARRIASDRFKLTVKTYPLPSYSDQNFLLKADDGQSFVLKIASAAEDRGVLEAQNDVLTFLQTKGFGVPAVCKDKDGRLISMVKGAGGTEHMIRLVTYLPGVLLATVSPHSHDLLYSLGHFVGTLDKHLERFKVPALNRTFEWDLCGALSTVRNLVNFIHEDERRAKLSSFTDYFEKDISPLLDGLPKSVIHGDANDYNVLVNGPGESERRVVGLIDFGDLVHSYTVGDLAIAAAYVMMGKENPIEAASSVIRGYHDARPLSEAELNVLFSLINMRLCLSVTLSARQHQSEPENEYVTTSEHSAWALLHECAGLHPRFVTYRFREACGLAPVPVSIPVVKWLSDNKAELRSILEPNPRTSPYYVFDFGVASSDWETMSPENPVKSGHLIKFSLEKSRSQLGIGRYAEPRLVYQSKQFAPRNGTPARTIHLGVDLFVDSGHAVFAPLDGIVHSVADNAKPQDYGPTVILEHQPADGIRFYTLYGHLQRDSIAGLRRGDRVVAGQPFARIGDHSENGGWAPHLHVQLITDLLGWDGNYPGVAPFSEVVTWQSLSPNPADLVGLPADTVQANLPDENAVMMTRTQFMSPSLSLSYKHPLFIVRGKGCYLYDRYGQKWIDCVNNVAHVGHCHPAVVDAGRRQMSVLNTNTRYLHHSRVEYARRLTETLPDPLSVCYLVNSGSEANDLALRLAAAYTGQRDNIVLDGAYHGHLTSLIDISPYKHNGPGGHGTPETCHAVPTPDLYRGLYRSDDINAGKRYAVHVRDIIRELAEKGRRVSSFISESIMSCAGQIPLPPRFLTEVYRFVHAAGGVCIADEVQVGFGRVGSKFWGFELQRVTPDIVTMGKPIGNGHPIGAVVTTPEIADAFNNGMEYFNTFGGNPVSCAIGNAVLDVLESEALPDHALSVGDELLSSLRKLKDQHPIIGDVRGSGLFLGVEFVRDADSLTPSKEAAGYVVERMKENGLLLSTDGPHYNVIKIKPPMVFGRPEVSRLVETMDTILKEDYVRAQMK